MEIAVTGKKLGLIILLVLSTVSTPVFSKGYEKVDRIVQNYPDSFSNPDQLARLINRDFTFPEEKARAIFTWIALNIEYDINALNTKPERISFSYSTEEEKLFKLQKIKEDLAIRTLRRGKGVCQGYATLFQQVCDLVSLECTIISGSSKTRKTDIGKLPQRNDHAWNAVKIDGEWRLIDVTWGAGYSNGSPSKFIPSFNDFFFFTPPDKFFLNHYPEDPVWLFTDDSPEIFADLPLYYSSFKNTDIEVKEPRNGVINTSGKSAIRIVLKNIRKETVSIKFDNEKYAVPVQPKIKNDFRIYDFEYNRKTNTYLTVFINTVSFVTFKIQTTD